MLRNLVTFDIFRACFKHLKTAADPEVERSESQIEADGKVEGGPNVLSKFRSRVLRELSARSGFTRSSVGSKHVSGASVRELMSMIFFLFTCKKLDAAKDGPDTRRERFEFHKNIIRCFVCNY